MEHFRFRPFFQQAISGEQGLIYDEYAEEKIVYLYKQANVYVKFHKKP